MDYAVFYEGEIPFCNIIKKTLLFKEENRDLRLLRQEAIDGTRALYENEFITGGRVPLIGNLDSIPSPYLSGVFDELLRNPVLMPMIQKTRGCPYECVFCVSGL